MTSASGTGLRRWLLGAVALFMAAGCDHSSEPVSLPGLAAQLPRNSDLNVLVVSFDALRADALGLYGYARPTSPNLDRFARQALVFDNAYTAAPVTPTSFAAAFTGQYPYRVFLGWQLMPVPTLAGLMQQSGRVTFGLLNNVQLAVERKFDQGYQTYQAGGVSDRELLTEAEKKLEEVRDRPFFGWVHFISPHTPYTWREMASKLAPRETEGRFAKQVPANYEVQSDAELARARQLYDGEIYFVDSLFGQLMKKLQNLGLADKTIVVVTADHGEEFLEHGHLGHKSLYREVVRIPLLIRHPQVEAGSRTGLPYQNVDLLPTLASIVGLSLPPDLDGRSLLEPVPAERVRVMAGMTAPERYQMGLETGGRTLMQLCTPEFQERLYDLASDPDEQHDLVLDRPDLAGELADLLKRHTGIEPCQLIVNSVRGKVPEELLSDEQVEQLKSLGYVQ